MHASAGREKHKRKRKSVRNVTPGTCTNRKRKKKDAIEPTKQTRITWTAAGLLFSTVPLPAPLAVLHPLRLRPVYPACRGCRGRCVLPCGHCWQDHVAGVATQGQCVGVGEARAVRRPDRHEPATPCAHGGCRAGSRLLYP
jgi:hypothetical protein